jgi:adenosylmethionine-8-amino-7-oxononanoate aminotransferase
VYGSEGAIGVIELHQVINLQNLQPQFVAAGVWVRPFNKLIYLMPPFIITDKELDQLIMAVVKIVSEM